MITLDPIYRDITSKFNQGSKDEELTRTDILVAINDAIASLRNEYVTAGFGQSFAITEEIDDINLDQNYPFLFVGTLTKDLLKRVSISKSVISAIGYKSTIVLTNGNHTRTVGDIAYRVDEDEQHLLECVESYTDKNHYDLFFRPSEFRQYRQNNKLKYKTGDAIFDGVHYWKIVTDFVNDKEYTFVESAPGVNQIVATKLYWKEIGEVFTNPVFVEFDRINEMKLATRHNFTVCSVKDNKIYLTPKVPKIMITYVPEWTYVNDLSTNVQVPYELIEPIKQRAIAALAIKLRQQSGASQ